MRKLSATWSYPCFKLGTCLWATTRKSATVAARRHFNHATALASTDDKLKILFFGRDEFSCTVLEQLYAADGLWDDIQLVTQPDTKTGRRGSQLSISPLKLLGQSLKLPLHEIPEARPEFRRWRPPTFGLEHQIAASEPQALPPSHVLVTASFGRILSSALLNRFAPGRRLNVHPSLLPKYRGAAPIQHAIINGDKESGVCITEMMEFKKGIDAGEIWGCRRIGLPEDISFPLLRDIMAREGGQLLVDVLRDMKAGKAVSYPQVHDPTVPRAPAIEAVDAVIDCSNLTAQQISRRYRGIAHQKPIVVHLKTHKTLQLHSPAVLTEPPVQVSDHLVEIGTAIYHPPTKSLVIRCASDTYISVLQVKQQDRTLLQAKEWWNGVRPEMRLHPGEEGPIKFLSPSFTA